MRSLKLIKTNQIEVCCGKEGVVVHEGARGGPFGGSILHPLSHRNNIAHVHLTHYDPSLRLDGVGQV